MYINMDTGQWMDFKAHRGGNFIMLVSMMEGISYDAAKKSIASQLWDEGIEFTDDSAPSAQVSSTSDICPGDELKNFQSIPDTITMSNHPSVRKAYMMLRQRKLPFDKFMVCTEGKYRNRLIIPYFDGSDQLFYFQARTLEDSDIKYLNPGSKDYGVKASDLLYPFRDDCNYVVVTEGPIDAIVLQSLGINATSTQGSHLSIAQARMLAGDRTVILSYDNDEAGHSGMTQARRRLLECMHSRMAWVLPPFQFKDWNDYVRSATKKEARDYLTSNVMKSLEEYALSGLLA